MKSLVIGAGGFLGSHLIDDLLEQGHEVKAFDRSFGGSNRNLEHLIGKIELLSGDFLNLDDLSRATTGVDYVFNMISFSTPASSLKNPRRDLETNIIGMINLLNLCVENKIKKVFFPSSGGTIYGNSDKSNSREDDPTNPICPYGISKLVIEKYLEYYHRLHNLDYFIFRISNPYGERQSLNRDQGVIPIFMNLIKEKKPITIFGNGENVRDYIYVKEVTKLIAKAVHMDNKNKIYNIGSGQGHSLNELIDVIREICGYDFEINYQPERGSDVRRAVLDISRARNELNFEPKINLQEGLTETWRHINSN